MAKGRPRKPGKRSVKTDRLIMARDYGNIRVVERHSRFSHFIDDKGLVFEGTSAGRLWIVGAFDGLDIDGGVLRDHLLEYGRAYWGEYPSCAGVANYLQENRRGNPGGDYTDPDPRGERFRLLDDMLNAAGQAARSAVHHIAVDGHYFPDSDRPWIAAIINSRVLDRRKALARAGDRVPDSLSVTGELACDSDRAMLELARLGAMALASGQRRKLAA